ncbi:hypothetical protein [uncultured Paenibacillus sp.]|uniref:hypothetical protein n=1 Tax=uncultured Paenibacillus sp. TaxID=227322 RepID=UPI0013E3059E|nr:hypothetical protein [uncultured Paenibacillus sp.]
MRSGAGSRGGKRSPDTNAAGEKAPVLREVKQGVVEGSEAPILNAEGEKAPDLHEVKQGAGQRAKPCP